jgi:folylpolyglutamate synthase/dihydropteroate synthase
MDEMTKLFFEDNVKSLVLTKPGFEKGSNLPYLAECTKKLNEENNNSIDLKIIENPKDAILKSFELAYKKDEPLLICGSFYLLAEVKSLLQTL